MGAIAETAITRAAVELGIVVLRPLVEGGRYDLVLDTGPRLLRTQCKWARRKGGVIVIRIRTCRHTPNGYVRTTYSLAEIDGVAAWCPDTEECYFIPIEDIKGRASSTSGSLPLGTTRSSLYTGPRTTGLGL